MISPILRRRSVHAAKMRLAADTTIGAVTGHFTRIPFDTVVWDTDDFSDTANNRFLPAMGDGWYQIACNVRYDISTLSSLSDLTVMLHPYSDDPDTFLHVPLAVTDTNFGTGANNHSTVVLQKYGSIDPSDWDRVVVESISKAPSDPSSITVLGGSNGSWMSISYLGTAETIPSF